MRASVRNSLLAASLSLLATAGHAGTNGLYLPASPTGPGGEDSIETSTGARCRQSINSSGSYVDFGMTGTAARPNTNTNAQFFGFDNRGSEATAYARVTIPIGHRPKRIDCSQIFELELARLRRENELLRLGAR